MKKIDIPNCRHWLRPSHVQIPLPIQPQGAAGQSEVLASLSFSSFKFLPQTSHTSSCITDSRITRYK
jgi:hypothetical protein